MTTVFRWMIDWASDSDPTSMTTVFLSSNPMDDRMHDHDGSGRAAEQRAGPKKTIEFILIKDLAARCSAAQPEPLCILSSIEKQQSSKSGPSRRPSLSSIGHRSRVQVVFEVGSESAAQSIIYRKTVVIEVGSESAAQSIIYRETVVIEVGSESAAKSIIHLNPVTVVIGNSSHRSQVRVSGPVYHQSNSGPGRAEKNVSRANLFL